jgi:hypothetical protein
LFGVVAFASFMRAFAEDIEYHALGVVDACTTAENGRVFDSRCPADLSESDSTYSGLQVVEFCRVFEHGP